MSRANPAYDLLRKNDETGKWEYLDTWETFEEARASMRERHRERPGSYQCIPYADKPINIWMWLHGMPKSSIECIETGRTLREARYLLENSRMVYGDQAMVWMGAKNRV